MSFKQEFIGLIQALILPEMDSIKSKMESSSEVLDKQIDFIDKMDEKIDILLKSVSD